MGLRLRLLVAAVATVTLVHVLQFLYSRLGWSWLYYYPCVADVDGLPCRITRKVPIFDLAGYAIILAVSLLVLVPLGWWVLAPIRRLVPVVDQLGPQNLGYRVRPGRRGRAEDKRLGRALDAMMDRIASGYEGQRAFAANASHELRTPLALQRTLIEVGMAEQLTPEQSALLTSQLLATNTRNERLIEGLLVLAQADQGLAARNPQDLDRITRDVIDANAAFADANDVKVSTAVYPCRVPGDGILLERLVRNLVHNATKYNHPGGTVRVTVDGLLIVENTGPLVPPEDVARLFEPFTRLAATRIDHSGGSGLGLAIARSIVQAHDGTITADPLEGGGLRFTVRFPAA